jgi:hypothetical protein
VNEKRIRRLMWLMGLVAIYQKPNTPLTHACMCERGQGGERTQDSPLSAAWVAGRAAQSGLARTSRDIAFAMPCRAVDITYLPMRRRFLYLVAIHCPTVVCLQTMRGMDWHTRTILA